MNSALLTKSVTFTRLWLRNPTKSQKSNSESSLNHKNRVKLKSWNQTVSQTEVMKKSMSQVEIMKSASQAEITKSNSKSSWSHENQTVSQAEVMKVNKLS